MKSIEQRFWKKVDIRTVNECWEWNACQNNRGYGGFLVNYQKKKAHRVGFELVYGPIPKGLCVLHSCDNPPCCNPEHWFLGTQQDNVDDMWSKHRKCAPQGDKHWNTKLTERKVLLLRKLRSHGWLRKQLAQLFNICPVTVGNIYNRQTWKHI